jgi:poly(A) polymerase
MLERPFIVFTSRIIIAMNSVRKNEHNHLLRDGAVEVVRCLRQAGYKAYWAGGCVRDMLLGHDPADYDVATDALPDQVIKLFPRCVEVGKAFGVIQVLLPAGAYDVATFRAESSYSDGRRPDEVTWAHPREDVLRRDFTINGLLYDPMKEELVDFVGGQADLKARLIRAIGEPAARFEEDSLRVLRALRFSARLDFAIEEHTWEALKVAAPDIKRISVERVKGELERLLTEGGALHGLRMLHDVGLWRHVLPEITKSETAIQRFQVHGKLSPALAWANLFRGQGLDLKQVKELGTRLRFSNELMESMKAILMAAEGLATYPSLPVPERKRVVRQPCFIDATLLLSVESQLQEAIMEATTELRGWSHEELHPAPLLNGQTLAQAGYKPGPFFGKVLREVEDLQLTGSLRTKEEALHYVSEQAGKSA